VDHHDLGGSKYEERVDIARLTATMLYGLKAYNPLTFGTSAGRIRHIQQNNHCCGLSPGSRKAAANDAECLRSRYRSLRLGAAAVVIGAGDAHDVRLGLAAIAIGSQIQRERSGELIIGGAGRARSFRHTRN
jgi:hypothetical protein